MFLENNSFTAKKKHGMDNNVASKKNHFLSFFVLQQIIRVLFIIRICLTQIHYNYWSYIHNNVNDARLI